MGSRYLITGVQLGMLKGFMQCGKREEAVKLIDEILEDQFVFRSNLMIERDVQFIQTINYEIHILSIINEIYGKYQVEDPKEPIVGPLASIAESQSQQPIIINAPSTNVSGNNTPNNKVKLFNPVLASLLDNLFNSAISGFTNAGNSFVFGESLNANTVMA